MARVTAFVDYGVGGSSEQIELEGAQLRVETPDGGRYRVAVDHEGHLRLLEQNGRELLLHMSASNVVTVHAVGD